MLSVAPGSPAFMAGRCVCVCVRGGKSGGGERASGESTAECKQSDWAIRSSVTVDCKSLAASKLTAQFTVYTPGGRSWGC